MARFLPSYIQCNRTINGLFSTYNELSYFYFSRLHQIIIMAKISDENLIFEIFIKRKKLSIIINHFPSFPIIFQACVNFSKSSRII